MAQAFDVVVIGAGAAGMMCAAVAGQRGRSVLLIDHAPHLGEKIRISGGGRCNFTNLGAGPANYLSDNPHFCRSALSRYTAQDFIALVRRHGIAFHEKHKGQLFCDDSAQQIIDLLVAECETGGVAWRRPCSVAGITQGRGGFVIDAEGGEVACESLVIATGGLPVPKIGATDFGLRIARQFGLKVIEPRPALVPLTFDAAEWAPLVELAGVSLEVEIRSGKTRFLEDLLFTHRGLSGPAVLQISSYWRHGESLSLDLAPGHNLEQALLEARSGSKQQLQNLLAQWLPRRLADHWANAAGLHGRAMAETGERALRGLAQQIHHWTVTPSGSEGYRKAEVMVGGVDTRGLDQKTLVAQKVPGLHFIGEVVDVTGWLGGYNFQWAWASGYAAGMAA